MFNPYFRYGRMEVVKKIAEILAENICELRKKKGLNQDELGARAGISGQAIGTYERMIRWPSVEQVSAMAKALGVEEAALFASDLRVVQVERVSVVDQFRDLVVALAALDNSQIPEALAAVDQIIAHSGGLSGRLPDDASDEPDVSRKPSRRLKKR